MFGFLGLLFALSAGTVAAHPALDLSFHPAPAAARDVVVDGPMLPSPEAPVWPAARQGGLAAPIFPEYRPEEWVSLLAHQLHVADTRIAQAAIWISSWPVQVDVSPNRVYVAVKFHGP